jgi:hypothetical protein
MLCQAHSSITSLNSEQMASTNNYEATKTPAATPTPGTSSGQGKSGKKDAEILVGSQGWVKKKKKAEVKKALKRKRKLQGPTFPHSVKITGPQADTDLSLAQWHIILTEVVAWVADYILASPIEKDLRFLNIEEYKFVENPEKDGVNNSLRPDKERKGYGLLLFNNLESKNIGIEAVLACGLPDPAKAGSRVAPRAEVVVTDIPAPILDISIPTAPKFENNNTATSGWLLS